jgi:hypothetical protein
VQKGQQEIQPKTVALEKPELLAGNRKNRQGKKLAPNASFLLETPQKLIGLRCKLSLFGNTLWEKGLGTD